jgi:PPM family protein phosphatase
MRMIVSAALSDPGHVREGNEDAYVADATLGLFAVADGLGGHEGGEVASRLAADTLTAFISASSADPTITWPEGINPAISIESNQLQNAVILAHRRIRQKSMAQPELEGMGTTIVAGLLKSRNRLSFVSVGDSRLYLWRAGALSQLSSDDTWIASMIRAGASEESLRDHNMQHMLTKALGSVPSLELVTHETEVEDGDILLMCSDGLYGPIGDAGIAQVLADTAPNLDQGARALVDAANAAGGPDNITVVLFRADDARG